MQRFDARTGAPPAVIGRPPESTVDAPMDGAREGYAHPGGDARHRHCRRVRCDMTQVRCVRVDARCRSASDAVSQMKATSAGTLLQPGPHVDSTV